MESVVGFLLIVFTAILLYGGIPKTTTKCLVYLQPIMIKIAL